MRKRQFKCLGYVMRKEGLENLILKRQIEGKRNRGKQCKKYLMGLSKLMVEHSLGEKAQRQNLLRVTRDRTMWKAKIAFVLE